MRTRTQTGLEKSYLKATLESEEAAMFLNITSKRLAELTKRGDIRMWRHKKRDYYLGGELDVLKYNLRNSLASPLTNF